MKYKIKINSPEHSEKLQNILFSLGCTWYSCGAKLRYIYEPFILFDTEKHSIYWLDSEYEFNTAEEYQEAKLVESYEFEEVNKRNVVKFGEKSVIVNFKSKSI